MKNKMTIRQNSTIKARFITIVIGNLILFTAVTFSLMLWFQSILEDKISESAKQSVTTVTGNLDVYVNNIVRLSDSITADSEIQKLLRENRNFDSAESVWSLVEILKQLKGYSVVNASLYSIGIYSSSGQKMLSTADGIYRLPEGLQPDWLDKARKYRNSPFVGNELAYSVPIYSQGTAPTTFSVVRKLQTDSNEDHVLFLNSYQNVLGSLVGDYTSNSKSGIVILNEAGESVFVAGHSDVRKAELHDLTKVQDSEPDLLRNVELGDQKYYVIRQQSSVTNWTVALFIPEGSINGDITVMKKVLITILALLSVLSLLLFTLLYFQLSNPIKQLMVSMQRVEKGLPFIPLRIDRMDELGFLQQRFNQMIENEQQMQKLIFEEQLHNKEIELKFLQSQVNPHFLYNTLDSIYWVAEESKVPEISSIVLDLSRFFRLSLSRGKDFISIKETIEHLHYYIRIQQFRHSDKFTVTWDIDPRLLEVKIMKLMLQPVVENAIVHGLEAVAQTCKLHVLITQEDRFLLCSVTDTGAGIPEERLQEIRAEIAKNGEEGIQTYGLKNLYQRLLILYGNDMRFEVNSSMGAGTNVSIRIDLNRLEGWNGADESDHRRG